MTYAQDELSLEDNIAAIATPLVPAAIAVIRTSGKGSIELVARVFSRPAALLEASGNTMVHGWIQSTDGHRLDEVVLGVWKHPASYTAQDGVEVFCHGGVAVVQAVFKLLLSVGFRQAHRGEFTLRSYLAGKIDLTQAEAVAELIDGKTHDEAMMAASRLSGSVSECIGTVKKQLIDTLASIEVEVEYPEDEDNFSRAFDVAPLVQVHSTLAQLASSWKVARVYQDGVRVVLCGKSNAGKSTLFNALIKEERAITSPQAGTTRDWIEVQADFAGVPVHLFDTAGLRDTAEAVELEGQDRTRQLVATADIVIYVVDKSVGVDERDLEYVKEVRDRGQHIVLAANKCDIAQGAMTHSPCDGRHWDARADVSAKTGAGVDTLSQLVAQLAVGDDEDVRHTVALGTQRQKLSVDAAVEAISHAIAVAQERTLGLDAVAQDVEDAISALSAITGEVTSDDILDSVFSHFCVGK